MRSISEALQTHLNTGATTLCRCWELRRKDGEVLGFSDHDKDLSFEGTHFAASSGMDARALQSSSGLSVDNSEALGALSEAGLSEVDIQSGLFDGAEIRHWYVNWADTSQRVLMFKGTIGEIRHGPNSFEAELRGLADKLNQNVGRSYLRQCSAQLGDQTCNFDTDHPEYSTRSKTKRVDANRLLYCELSQEYEEGWFSYGHLVWESGANAGQRFAIRSDAVKNGERRIELNIETPMPIEPDDEFKLIAGCNKQFETCRAKFDNVINFQGFPYIPGEDWALSYPIQGQGNDGGSLLGNTNS